VKIIKCPRCELNYIREGEKVCRVCAREMKVGLADTEETVELCAACGENPALPGKDLCAKCLREHDEHKDDMEAFVDDEDELVDDVAELSVDDSMGFGEPGLQTTSLSELEEEEYRVDDEDDEY